MYLFCSFSPPFFVNKRSKVREANGIYFIEVEQVTNLAVQRYSSLPATSQHKKSPNCSTCHSVRPILNFQCLRDPPPENEAHLYQPSICKSSSRGNAASTGTFSGVGIDGSRWEQDRDYGRDGLTPPSRNRLKHIQQSSSYLST
ncbi:hypothetical protein AVEN_11943-1 [Araneus ventricosus]|uniref:Uncharacterized protein n=1 Tax=Araneus ventricosus TaxID=182803 RepID=A0A4Y2L343_ARAVE|nr:hypothetical protein AVEN_11943-1 [Araneus ventricosus]